MRLMTDLPQADIFLCCNNGKHTDARELNQKVEESAFFIPIVTAEYPNRPNCVEELRRARERKGKTATLPVILPIKLQCDLEIMRTLEFPIDQASEKGEIWTDCQSNADLIQAYQTILGKLLDKALEYWLLLEEDFNKDCKILDVILTERKPTSFYVKSAIDACKKGQEYGLYFFKRLEHPSWLPLFQAYDFFDKNPVPYEPDPEKQKGMFQILLWPVLFYLEKISKNPAADTATRLMDIIRQVTKPLPPLSRADNYRTWHFFIKIMANLPTNVVTLDDIELIQYWLEGRFDTTLVGSEIGQSLLPRFLSSDKPEDWRKATRLIEIVTEITSIPGRIEKDSESEPNEEPQLKMSAFWMKELFKKNADLLGPRCGKEVISCLSARLTELLKKTPNEDKYAYVWRPAIEDHEQNVGEDRPNHVLIEALRDVLLAYVKHASTKDGTSLLKEMLENELDVIKRIAIYVMDSLFDKYASLFWKKLDSKLFKSNLRHELYMLFQHRFESFSSDQKDKVVALISNLTHGWKEDKDKEKMDALLRAEWISAVIGKGSLKADTLYENCKKVLGKQYKPEHPQFLSYTTSGGFSEESPVSSHELLAMGSVKEIVAFLNRFEGKNAWGEPSNEGLGETLKAAVKSKPELFEGNLDGFLECKYPYQLYVIKAFRDLWKDKKPVAWGKLLAFCKNLVNKPKLWQKDETQKDRYKRKDWIPTAVAQLIEEGVRQDETAFDAKHLPEAGEVLKIILNKQEPWQPKEERGDLLTWAINTPRGRTIEAFVSYALRCVRLAEKSGEAKEKAWQELEPVFDRELELIQSKDNCEFSAIAGRYLPNLYYMSKDWVEKNIGILFPNKDAWLAMHWLAALDGYSYVSTVYTVIYDLLKKNGDLEKVLNDIRDHKRIRERTVDNISISYLRGQESLAKDSLFAKILGAWQDEDVCDVIGLFWSHREVEFKNSEDRHILEFWNYCYEKIKGRESEKQGVLSDLNLLAVFLKEITPESKEWLLQCVPYVEYRYHSTFLLEYLDRLADVSPQDVGEVCLAMLKNTIPTFKEENIKSIVTKLYKSGKNGLADQICDRYGRAGHEFLREIYDHYYK